MSSMWHVYSNEQLIRIIETKPVGNFYPYNTDEYDYDAVDEYISKVVGSLASIRSIEFEADFESYGSGYASYVDVFCWKRDGSSSEQRDGVFWIDGIRIYICRLAPVAVMGVGQITKHDTGGSSDYIEPRFVNELPSSDWEDEIYQIKNILESNFLTILDREYVNQPLDFEAKIPTILADKPYKIFDALFYWED